MPTPAEKWAVWHSGYSLSTNRWTAARLAPQTGRVVLEGFWFTLHQYWAATELVLLVLSACTSHTKLFFFFFALSSSLWTAWFSANQLPRPLRCYSGPITLPLAAPCMRWGPRENNSGHMCNWCSVGSFVNLNRCLNEDSGWWCRKEKGWLISELAERTLTLLGFGSLTNVTTWHSQFDKKGAGWRKKMFVQFKPQFDRRLLLS